MNLPLPSSFNSKLSNERLETVANWLLEEFYATQDDLTRPTDSEYSRGCTTFDRQKNRIIREARSGKYSWLELSNTTFDLVFNIDGIPCRFSNDDPSKPSKTAVLSVNRLQMGFMEFVNNAEPGHFCFIVDHVNHGEPSVEFLGFTPTGDVVCSWSSHNVRVFRIEDQPLIKPVDVAKPQILPKKRSEGDADIASEK